MDNFQNKELLFESFWGQKLETTHQQLCDYWLDKNKPSSEWKDALIIGSNLVEVKVLEHNF